MDSCGLHHFLFMQVYLGNFSKPKWTNLRFLCTYLFLGEDNKAEKGQDQRVVLDLTKHLRQI